MIVSRLCYPVLGGRGCCCAFLFCSFPSWRIDVVQWLVVMFLLECCLIRVVINAIVTATKCVVGGIVVHCCCCRCLLMLFSLSIGCSMVGGDVFVGVLSYSSRCFVFFLALAYVENNARFYCTTYQLHRACMFKWKDKNLIVLPIRQTFLSSPFCRASC
jgi:hypothetical protein